METIARFFFFLLFNKKHSHRMQKFRQEKQAESQQMLSRYFDMASHYTAACKVSHSRKVKKKQPRAATGAASTPVITGVKISFQRNIHTKG